MHKMGNDQIPYWRTTIDPWTVVQQNNMHSDYLGNPKSTLSQIVQHLYLLFLDEWLLVNWEMEEPLTTNGIYNAYSGYFLPMCGKVFMEMKTQLPFRSFETKVLCHLWVTPSQLHPNCWPSSTRFRLFGNTWKCQPINGGATQEIKYDMIKPFFSVVDDDKLRWNNPCNMPDCGGYT